MKRHVCWDASTFSRKRVSRISNMTAVLAQPVLFLIVNQGRCPSRARKLISSILPQFSRQKSLGHCELSNSPHGVHGSQVLLTKTLQLNSTLYLFETLQHFRLSCGISSFCKPFLEGDCSRRRRPRSPWRGLSSDDPRQDRTTFSAGSFMFAIKPSAPTKEASGQARIERAEPPLTIADGNQFIPQSR